MATFHGLPQFDDTTDRWDALKIRLEAYFEAHDLTGVKKKRALLVSALSTRAVEVLAGRRAPTKINELEYSEVVQLLHDPFSPQRNEVAESSFCIPWKATGTPRKKEGSYHNQDAKNDSFGRCKRCGKTGHIARPCRFRNSRCLRCQQEGHLARTCPKSDFVQKNKVGFAKKRRQIMTRTTRATLRYES
ncbi:hypothetical protein HPB47_024141 [Ixodes persulcatus]|uniref:Uncharacterized protein n=1 Tax=Ixodes persulcatus TaxID=34615 RepID=A0AC60Q539_IXOPE|nr:hypothetical protein HPB47_024141 [Ixodes persulcatus]